MNIISFCSVKGGTGKTTLSVTTALSLKLQGFKVLFLDLDPQNSSTFFFIQDDLDKSVFKALMGDGVQNNIVATQSGVDLLPSDLRLFDCRTIETTRVKQLLNQVKDDYDYCIIDTAPTYDNLTIGAYLATNTIIIPGTVDVFTAKTIHFLFDKFEQLEIEKEIGIVLNMFQPSKSENPNIWSKREAALFYEDERIRHNLINTTVPRSQTLHRLIAEDGYKIKGKALLNLTNFVNEITGQQLTIDFIGGVA